MVRQKDDMEKKKREKKRKKKEWGLEDILELDNKTFNITGKILLKWIYKHNEKSTSKLQS